MQAVDEFITHRLLKRQIKKHLSQNVQVDIVDLLKAVNQAYIEFDNDLKRTEHILEESSKELFKANKELQKIADQKTIEAAENADRLKTVAESISEVIFQLDQNGHWIYLNPAWENIMEFPVNESLGKSIFDFVLPEDKYILLENFKPLMQGTKEKCQRVLRFVTSKSEHKWVQIGAQITKNKLGEIVGMSGSLVDITANYLTQRENEKLALLVQKTRNVMLITDTEGYITWVNSAFTNLTEFSLDEVKGKRPGNFLQGPKTSAETKREIKEHIIDKKSYYGEIINYTKSGKEYWIEIHIDPIYDEKDNFMGYIAVENQIDQRKKQQALLIESEAKLSAVINNIPDFIFYKNTFGQYELANKAFCHFFNLKPEEINGKTDFDLYDEHNARFIIDNDNEAMNLGITRTKDGELQGKNGETILLETTKSPVYDNENNLRGLVGISRDITEIKKAQIKIIESEERLKLTTTSLSIGIFDWDVPNNNLIWDSSMYKLFEVEEGDFNGAYQAFEACLYPADKEIANAEVAESLSTGKKLDSSFRIHTKDGSIKHIKVSATVFQDQLGNPLRMVGINYDITNQAIAEQKLVEYTANLEKINAELDQFAYVVSHDLKAPLRAINNLSSWIEEDLQGKMDNDTQEQFALLRGRVLRMEGLINGILEYSRAGRIKANNQLVNVQSLVYELCDSLKTKENIEYHIAANLPTIFTEKVALEQVFSNFISNAIKYNDKSQVDIWIDFKIIGNKLHFSVRDNGPGIDEKYYEKIFVIFQTLQARDQFESTGVGLAIVKKIIEEKDCKVWVESTLKEGTTFHFTWPFEQK